MCGISGIISKDKIDINYLREISYKINHRGPDNQGFWQSDNKRIAFAHNRLTIIDLSNLANQPMISNNGRYILSYNGEIYNFKKLKDQLSQNKKISWKTNCDTEVLLEMIANFGLDYTLKSINGMFAFSLYDKLKNDVFLCRDNFGEKPIYYRKDKNNFIFSSEIKSLIQKKSFEEINQQALSYYLKYGFIPSPYTIYKNVNKLEPGHYIQINNCDICNFNIKKYYNFFDISNVNSNANSIEENSAILSNKLTKTLEEELVSDVPIGVFLSGGIDSSLITLFANKVSSKKIKTFNLFSENDLFDESKNASRVSEFLNTEHFDIKVSHDTILDNLNLINNVYDEPFSDPAQLITFILCKETSKHVKVCLSGDGGDELFGGYNRYLYTNNLFKNRILDSIKCSILKKINSVSLEKIYNKIFKFFKLKDGHSDIGLKFEKYIKLIESSSILESYDNLLSINTEGSSLLKSKIGDDIFYHEKYNELSKAELTNEEMMMYLDTLIYLPENILFKVDRASMFNSLEVRAPFLNNRLSEFSKEIPLSQKILKKNGKYILRKILEDNLPKSLIKNYKKGFSVPIKDWIDNPLKKIVYEKLNENNIKAHNLLNYEKTNEIISQHYNGKKNNQEIIWNLLNFQTWIEQ